MNNLTLTRFAATPWGTFGSLTAEGIRPIFTLEKQWRENIPYRSCIPPGEYPISTTNRARLDAAGLTHLIDALQIDAVPDRDGILIHVGNFEEETHGCILVGERIALINGRPGVSHSVGAMIRLMHFYRARSPSAILIQWATAQPIAHTE